MGCLECGWKKKGKQPDECPECGGALAGGERKASMRAIQISDDVIISYNPGGGFVVRVKGKPVAFPTTWYGVLRHVRDCRVRGAALKTVAELVAIEERQEAGMRELAAQITEKMGARK